MIFRQMSKSSNLHNYFFLSFCHNPRVWQTDRRTDRIHR